MNYAIEADDLTRYYREERGVDGLDLRVPEGSIFGLLGENASGKTTAIKLAMGHLIPDRGTIQTLATAPGDMPPDVRARIGYLSDQLAVPDRMSLRDAMALQADYFPTWSRPVALDLANRFDLTPISTFGDLSLGQKRRFMLTLVIAQMPDLMVLDEPAGGLDAAVRREFIDILLDQAADRPMTIVLSSHILSDVERLIDRVAFLKDGRVVKQSDLETLRENVKRICLPSPAAADLVRERFRVRHARREGEAWLGVVEDFSPERLDGIQATVEHMNLEDLFIAFNQPRDRKAA